MVLDWIHTGSWAKLGGILAISLELVSKRVFKFRTRLSCYLLVVVVYLNSCSFASRRIFYGMRVEMNVRVAPTNAVYRKSLKLSSSNNSATGIVVHLISNDVQRFEDA